MKIAFVSALLLGLAAAAPALEERATNNYKKVVADVAAIKKATAALTAAVKALHPNDLQGSATILNDTQALENDIQTATSDANSSAPFGSKGSELVGVAVLELVSPTKASLNELIKKKSAFTIEGISEAPIVLNSLQTLKSDTDNFGAAVAAKLDKTFRKQAPAVQKEIDNAFNKAIKAYSSGSIIPRSE